jgi:hypothetical protein
VSNSTLVAHCGARLVNRAELESVEPPPGSATWVPIKHSVLLDRVGQALTDAGFGIKSTKIALSRGNHRLFSTIDTECALASGGITLAVAVVNSTDKSLPMKMIAGTRIFCCDNLSLRSDLMASAIQRKHTRFGLDRFHEALALAVSTLDQFKKVEGERVKRFQDTEVTDIEAESVMLRSYERGIVSHRLLPRLIKEWRTPSFADFEPRTLWSLENAHTTVLGKVAQSNPQRFCSLSLSLQSLLSEAVLTLSA